MKRTLNLKHSQLTSQQPNINFILNMTIHNLLPLLPPFLRVLSVGMGVTSSGKQKIMQIRKDYKSWITIISTSKVEFNSENCFHMAWAIIRKRKLNYQKTCRTKFHNYLSSMIESKFRVGLIDKTELTRGESRNIKRKEYTYAANSHA